MRKVAAQPMLTARRGAIGASTRGAAPGCALLLGGAPFLGCALLLGCATGVDVTDEELAAICSEMNTICGNAGAAGSVGGSTGGGVGGSASGGTFGTNGGTGSLPSNGGSQPTGGGTGGTTQGTSGSGGTGGSVPLAQGDCLDTDDILVLYRDRNSGALSTNEPSMVLQVQNPGGTEFPLSDLAIRYWFTADGTSNFTATIDYATLNGQNNINGGIDIAFGQEFGSDYAELTFPTLTDNVGAEGVREVQLRFHAEPYAPLNQANDFSFLSTAATATANRNVTPYLGGTQVGGCVPIGP